MTGGTGYRVGDTLNFNNTNTGGDSAYARVSKVKGKSISNISVASSSISGVEYIQRDLNFTKLFVTIPMSSKLRCS